MLTLSGYAGAVNFIDLLNLVGVLTFAATGTLVARRKRFDIIGALVLAAVTAIGGGSIRDVIFGVMPPSSLQNEPLLWSIAATALIIYFLPRHIGTESYVLYVLDTIGLAVFAALGAASGVAFGVGMWATIFAGAVSGVGGGVIRDVLTGRIPGIFYRAGDWYASAAALGALTYFLVHQLDPNYGLAASIGVTLFVRFGSRWLGVSVPIRRSAETDSEKDNPA